MGLSKYNFTNCVILISYVKVNLLDEILDVIIFPVKSA